jgi:hypothetical protein
VPFWRDNPRDVTRIQSGTHEHSMTDLSPLVASSTAPAASPRVRARRVRLTAIGLAVAISGSALLAQIPKDLRYGPRTTHNEGLLSDLKGAGALVLVSATAVGRDTPPAQWPESLRLRFFLPKEQSHPSVSVIQLESLTGYYALDKIRSASWTAGSANEYAWKTDMVRNVYEYQTPASQRTDAGRTKWLAGLGALVTLGAPGAASLQKITVAPAVIATSKQPAAIAAYRFTFKATMASATVTGQLKSAAGVELLSGLKYPVSSGTPFTVEWRPSGTQAEGVYTLTVEATTAPGQPHTEVTFFHKRAL